MQISLTDSVDVQAKLKRKLAEYQQRLAFQAPEVDPQETYKLRILQALLDDGIIDLEVMMITASKVSWFDQTAFMNAAQIVEIYNTGRTDRLMHGTGLQ